MLRYVARRLVIAFFILFVITTATFFIMQTLPGTPFNDEKLSGEAQARLEARYGLDEPLVVQYGRYMSNVVRGDFGDSFYYSNRPALGIILDRAPVSAFLGTQAIVFGLVVGMGLGAVGALRHNTSWDKVATVVSVLGISIPSFVLAPLMLLDRGPARLAAHSLFRELDPLHNALAGALGLRYSHNRPVYADGDA